MSEMREWFFLRPGFENFMLDPKAHRRVLIGNPDRSRRDDLIDRLDGAARSMYGQKAVIFGDYGRGKTHLCHNLIAEMERRQIGIKPVYIKCSEYVSKEKFSTFFRDMVLRHDPAELQRLATAYQAKVQSSEAEPLPQVIDHDEVAQVVTEGFVVPNQALVKRYMKWLGGEAKVDMSSIAPPVRDTLTTGRDFAAVLQALAHLYRTIDGRVLLYVIDEAERVEGVAHADTFTTWKSAFRELTEVQAAGMLFLVGAHSRNDLPVLFVGAEIMRRIGAANYIEIMNPSKEQLRAFLLELFQTLIRKGEAPETQWEALNDDALDDSVPGELMELLGHDVTRLQTYPFEPEAFDEFIDHLLSAAEFGNKPSEALARLQKAAQMALTSGKRVIGTDIVDAIQAEGF